MPRSITIDPASFFHYEQGKPVVSSVESDCYRCHANGPRALDPGRQDLVSGWHYVDLASPVLHLTDPDARHIYVRTVFASTCLQCPGRLGFRSSAAAEYDQDGRYGISRCRTFRCKGAVLWLSSCASFPGTG